jgi:folate-dependent tRNA-U54 methylase TrmFO/GidA
MNVNLGIFPPLETDRVNGRKKISKQERSLLFAERSLTSLEKFLTYSKIA